MHIPSHEMFRAMATSEHGPFHAELCQAVSLQEFAVRPDRSDATVDGKSPQEFNCRQRPVGGQLLRARGQQRFVALRWPQSMKFEPTTVRDIINGLVQVLPIFAGDQVVVHIDDVAAALATMVDRIRLRQALLGLCSKARAAVNSDGLIRINAHMSEQFTNHRTTLPASGDSWRGSHVAIRISDIGCSIPVNLRNLLFEPLHAMWVLEEGIVIESSNIYRIVTSHGGWIEFENEFGVGTTFAVNLPVVETPPPVPNIELLERPLNSIANATSRRF